MSDDHRRSPDHGRGGVDAVEPTEVSADFGQLGVHRRGVVPAHQQEVLLGLSATPEISIGELPRVDAGDHVRFDVWEIDCQDGIDRFDQGGTEELRVG